MAWKKALTDEQEKRLVVDHEDGFKVVQLVERYGVSQSTVFRILSENNARRTIGNKLKKRKPLRAQAKGRTLKPCGTNAAYARHIKKGERPCTPCCEAHAAQQKAYEERKKNAG